MIAVNKKLDPADYAAQYHGMKHYSSFREVIDAFKPHMDQIELAKAMRVSPVVISSQRFRNWIPAEYWKDLIRVANRHEVKGITPETLTRLAAKRREEKRNV